MSYSISAFDRKIQSLARYQRQIPNRAATIAVAFSKDRFREQAWVDVRTEPWPKRGVPDKRYRSGRRIERNNHGRAILVRSGRLKRSVRKIRVGPTFVVIGTDVPYAAIHNYGGRIKKTATVKQHARKRGRKTHEVKSHTRQMNVTLPRRQFLGESQALARRIERDMAAGVLKVLREP